MYTMLYASSSYKYFENLAKTAKRKLKELDTTIYIFDSYLVWRMQLMIIKG